MTCYRLWTTLETKLVEMGILPKGRSLLACRVFCRRNGVKFPGKKTIEDNDDLINEIEKKFSQKKGHDMKKETKKTITASVKDAKAEKKSDDERKYSFRTIDIDKIFAHNNIRKTDEIADLVASISTHGIINPITVVHYTGAATYYNLVAGFRRYEAAKKLGLKSIPCHVIEDVDSLNEISLTENVSRMDMTPYEECVAVRHLINKKNTPAQIAKRFGRTLRWVLVRKKLADAGDEILEKVKAGQIALSAAAKLADLPDDVFKEELSEICGSLSDWDVKNILERTHMDLEKAPFDHSACLKCDKCSACQKDLFDDDPKAYCLDPDCWARKAKKAAEAKVKKLQEEGRNARIGKFFGAGVSCEDEANDFEIGKYNTKLQEQAKEAGIQKRILVDAATLKTFEYYDKRDLPDYHEETEEERQERVKKENEDHEFERVKNDMTKNRLRSAIANKIQKGEKDDVIALLLFCCYDLDDTIDESQHSLLGIKEDEDRCAGLSDIDDQVRPCDIHDAVLGSVEHILEKTYDIDILRKMYSIITYGNPKDAEPVDDEVEDEIKRIHEKKNEENNESENESQED